MRNSVILLDQIDQDLASGLDPVEAVVGSAVRRFRPIMLTAAAAVLALIPIAQSVFWGPLAYAMMGGILVATVLTILVLPAAYALFFRIGGRRKAAATSGAEMLQPAAASVDLNASIAGRDSAQVRVVPPAPAAWRAGPGPSGRSDDRGRPRHGRRRPRR